MTGRSPRGLLLQVSSELLVVHTHPPLMEGFRRHYNRLVLFHARCNLIEIENFDCCMHVEQLPDGAKGSRISSD